MRILLLGSLFCSLAFADAPSISGIAVVTDTNAVVVSYTVAPQAPYAVMGAAWSNGSSTFAIGTHSIQINDYVTVSSADPIGYNNNSEIQPGSLVTSVTSTTITVSGPAYNPGLWLSGGSVTVSPFCWVQYGVATGTYLWSSYNYNLAAYTTGYSSSCSIPITGLQDGATYYFLPTARPNADDENNICNTSACGAIEQTAATPAASTSHLPAAPASVQANLLSEPDTSSYVTIPLVDGGGGVNHECVAAAGTYSAPSGYPAGTPAVTAGQTLTTIMASGEMLYGMVFQIPQGINCMVPTTISLFGSGYTLPVVAVDPLATGGSIAAANHRWIIFRTAPGNATDFPPFATRTGPSFFSHYGGFESANPTTVAAYGTGTIFWETSGLAHHIWFENLKFSVDETQTSANYSYFFFLGNGEGGGSAPFPEYIVFRGNYFHGPARADITTGTPSIQGAVAGTIQAQMAIVGNYFDNLYYAGGPLGAGIVQGIYFLDCGNTATCGTGGPVLIDNNYMHGMAMNIYVEQTNFARSGAHDFTLTHNYLHYPYATFTYASNPTYFPFAYACRNQIEFKGMSKAAVVGNYINGAWACANTGAPFLFIGFNRDLTVASNMVAHVPSVIALGGLVPHQAGAVAGAGNRFLFSNNIAYDISRKYNGNANGNYQAGGGSLSASAVEVDAAVNNARFVDNTIGAITDGDYFSPFILENVGGFTGQMAGLAIQNNVLPFGLSITGFSGGIGTLINGIAGPGVLSHPSTPGVIQLTSPVNFQSWLNMNAGYTSNSPNLGMQGASVISGGSGYPNTGNLVFTGCTVEPTGVFNAVAGVIRSSTDVNGNPIPATNLTSFGSGCNPATMTVTAAASGGGSGASLRPHYGLTPSSAWLENVVACTDYLGIDMSQANCTSLSSTMPRGDTYAAGSNTAARYASAGATSNYAIVPAVNNSGTAGANLNQLYSATGTVTGVAFAVSSSAAKISYTAPDARACSADISPDGGVTWARMTDSGGAPQRSLSFTALAAGATYNYRLLCYFDQTSDLFSGNQVTDGTFSTLTAGTRNPTFSFALSAFPGATSFTITLTPVSGTSYTNTCTTSPCIVSNVPVGDYSAISQWLAGTTLLGSSDAQTVGVR